MRRREYLRYVGTSIAGITALSSTTSAKERFSLPDRITSDDNWAFEDSKSNQNHTFQWESKFGYNKRYQKELKKKVGVDIPINSQYTVWLNQLRYDNSSTNCRTIPINNPFINCIPENPVAWVKSMVSDSHPTGKQAKKLTSATLESKFGVSNISSSSGLDPHGYELGEMQYNKPSNKIINKTTYTGTVKQSSSNELGEDLSFRTFLVVQTPNDGKTFLAVARTIPDKKSVDIAGLGAGEITYDITSLESTAREDMKATSIQ